MAGRRRLHTEGSAFAKDDGGLGLLGNEIDGKVLSRLHW